MPTLPRNAQLWLPGYLSDRAARLLRPSRGPATVWLTFADHYEPRWRNAELPVARARVDRWRTDWPKVAAERRDHFDRPPRYTFFFAEEEYHPDLIDPLAELAQAGIADVEVHIHHDGEGEENFRQRMTAFMAALRQRHGLLHTIDDREVFGFIHGNWALDNCHPSGRWCGLNNELSILRELGCYADFTLPAAPDPCQTRMVNSIYWAVDDPQRSRSHDTGTVVTPGGTPPASALLMVQGPLGIRWNPRRGLRPALEVGELAGHDPVTPERVKAWLDLAPRIGDHVFVKLHSHGAPEKNAAPLLERDLGAALDLVKSACESRGWNLAHASAFEAAEAINALAGGRSPLPS